MATVRSVPQPGIGEYFAEPMQGLGNDPSGIGNVGASTMFGLAADAATPTSEGTNTALIATVIIGTAALRGVAGYFAGKAMGKKYRWWGVGSAVVFGAVGLGVLGAVAGSRE